MSEVVPIVKLQSFTKITKGKKPKKLSSVQLDDSYLPYILIESFGGTYNEFTNDDSCRKVEKNDIELVWDGERAGLTSIGHQGYLGSTLASVHVNELNASPKYVFFFFQLKQSHLRNFAEGTGVPHLSRWAVEQLNIPLPPLPEQKKIASILTSVDEVIENTQKQIDKLQDLKKATMNELLTKGIGHTEFKDSELGRIPKSWEVGKLKDFCKRVCVGFVGTCEPFYRPDGIPLIRTGDLKNGQLDTSDFKFVTREFHKKAKEVTTSPRRPYNGKTRRFWTNLCNSKKSFRIKLLKCSYCKTKS